MIKPEIFIPKHSVPQDYLFPIYSPGGKAKIIKPLMYVIVRNAQKNGPLRMPFFLTCKGNLSMNSFNSRLVITQKVNVFKQVRPPEKS